MRQTSYNNEVHPSRQRKWHVPKPIRETPVLIPKVLPRVSNIGFNIHHSRMRRCASRDQSWTFFTSVLNTASGVFNAQTNYDNFTIFYKYIIFIFIFILIKIF